MKSWPARPLLLAGAAALLVAIPATGQNRDSPESLLPPGFGDPANQPPPEDKAPPPPPPPPSASSPGAAPAPPSRTEVPGIPGGIVDAGEEEFQGELPRPTNYFAVPGDSRRPTDMVGPLGPGNFGLSPDAFGAANGAFLTTLMRRMDAPVASRWVSIGLRRALLSRVPAPPGIDPVDWVAERASLLLRMGEADAARLLVQSLDTADYTPRMIETAAQTALATADPGALCPIVQPARRLSNEPVWTLGEAMCAALEGEGARAAALVDEARRRHGGGIDLLLAEKVVGASAGTRRAVTVRWEGVDAIDPWRFGLASATGLEIPDELMGRAGAHIHAWKARAPMVPLEQRLGAASVAAAIGVFSSQSLVEIYSLMLDQTDPAEVAGTVAARLRTAWSHPQQDERIEALRSLWDEGEGRYERYARLILTAGAAARIVPSRDHADSAANLIASMLSAGMDGQAAQWAPLVADGAGGERAWALLAVAGPQPQVDSGRVSSFVDGDDSRGRRRSRALVAALAGLGRLSAGDAARLAASAGFALDREDVWTAAIDRAARERQPATVLLLAGTGMQTADWAAVPPHYLFHILRALRAVGLDFEARMIAAEAMTRL